MLATNFNSRIEIPIIDEGAAYGAAMLAAIGSGMEKKRCYLGIKQGSILTKMINLSMFIMIFIISINLYINH